MDMNLIVPVRFHSAKVTAEPIIELINIHCKEIPLFSGPGQMAYATQPASCT